MFNSISYSRTGDAALERPSGSIPPLFRAIFGLQGSTTWGSIVDEKSTCLLSDVANGMRPPPCVSPSNRTLEASARTQATSPKRSSLDSLMLGRELLLRKLATAAASGGVDER